MKAWGVEGSFGLLLPFGCFGDSPGYVPRTPSVVPLAPHAQLVFPGLLFHTRFRGQFGARPANLNLGRSLLLFRG